MSPFCSALDLDQLRKRIERSEGDLKTERRDRSIDIDKAIGDIR